MLNFLIIWFEDDINQHIDLCKNNNELERDNTHIDCEVITKDNSEHAQYINNCEYNIDYINFIHNF